MRRPSPITDEQAATVRRAMDAVLSSTRGDAHTGGMMDAAWTARSRLYLSGTSVCRAWGVDRENIDAAVWSAGVRTLRTFRFDLFPLETHRRWAGWLCDYGTKYVGEEIRQLARGVSRMGAIGDVAEVAISLDSATDETGLGYVETLEAPDCGDLDRRWDAALGLARRLARSRDPRTAVRGRVLRARLEGRTLAAIAESEGCTHQHVKNMEQEAAWEAGKRARRTGEEFLFGPAW